MDQNSFLATVSFYVKDGVRPTLFSHYTVKISSHLCLADALKFAQDKGFKYLREDLSIDSSVKISWVSVEFGKYLGSENEVE